MKQNNYYYYSTLFNVLEYLEVNYTAEQLLDDNYYCYQNVYDKIYDECFTADRVTGNASGSWFFSTQSSKKCVLANIEEVVWAVLQFDCRHLLADKIYNNEWEWLDVTARCYALGECLEEALAHFGITNEEEE